MIGELLTNRITISGIIALALYGILSTQTKICTPHNVLQTIYDSQDLTYQTVQDINIQKEKVVYLIPHTVATIFIKNTDQIGGEFTVNFFVKSGNDITLTPQKIELLPGEAKQFSIEVWWKEVDDITYKVIPPEKLIPRQETVTKQSCVNIFGQEIPS